MVIDVVVQSYWVWAFCIVEIGQGH